MKRIFLDYASTAPARPEAIAAMLPLLDAGGYNPSSLHAEGRAARTALDNARSTVARVLGAKPREIVFTSGGSESIGLAITGAAAAAAARERRERLHIVTAVSEHRAVLHAVDGLERAGWEVTRLAVDASGRVTPDALRSALRPHTVLATIMLANNEIGTLNPIAELAATARASGVVFHTDAVQAPVCISVDVDKLGVDLLSLAGHKFGAPKGVGVLYVRAGTPLEAQIVGGGQEHGLRAGTQNVAAIAALATALELAAAERTEAAERLGGLRDRLEAGLAARVDGLRINGAASERIATISSIAFADVAADALLIRLDLEGIAASAGSACAAGALEPSHVIAALDLPREFAGGVIRFSLGHMTTVDEVDRVIALVPQLVSELRDTSVIV